MPPSGLGNGEMRGIRGKRAVTKPGSRRKNARRQMIKAVRNVGTKSERPRKRRATPPRTSSENNHTILLPEEDNSAPSGSMSEVACSVDPRTKGTGNRLLF